MTTQEVANRYFELAQKGQLEQIQDELYSPDALSIEPVNDSNLPISVKGIVAMRQKEAEFYKLIDGMYGGFCKEPIVTTYNFACASGMDVLMKGKERKMKEQIGVFEVENGKIIKEQFFYNDFK